MPSSFLRHEGTLLQVIRCAVGGARERHRLQVPRRSLLKQPVATGADRKIYVVMDEAAQLSAHVCEASHLGDVTDQAVGVDRRHDVRLRASTTDETGMPLRSLENAASAGRTPR